MKKKFVNYNSEKTMRKKISNLLIIFIMISSPFFYFDQCIDYNNKNNLESVKKVKNSNKLEIDFELNNSIIYESHIYKLKMDWGRELIEKFIIYNKQNISIDLYQNYNIKEKFEIFQSYPNEDKFLSSVYYEYEISNVSNIPFNTSSTYPEIFNGGWCHNYPEKLFPFEVNLHEISYLNEIQQGLVLNLEYSEENQQEFNSTLIDTKEYNSKSPILENCTP